jgi:hypothetical protein
MKRRNTVLIAIAIVAALYAVPWLIAYRTANYSLMFEYPRPTTPAEFAAQYPVLNAVLWLIRVDMFAPMQGDVTALQYAGEINTHCVRNIALSLAVLATCMVLLLVRPYRKGWSRALVRTAQVLIGTVAVLSLALTTYSLTRHERVVPKWDRTRDTNILNNHSRFGGLNLDILVPESTQGDALSESDLQDIHIGVDIRGRISIAGAMLTRTQLVQIVSAKAAQTPPPRFLLWIDYRCRIQDRDAILSLTTNISPDETYVVVREGNHRDMNIVYKGVDHNKLLHGTAESRADAARSVP